MHWVGWNHIFCGLIVTLMELEHEVVVSGAIRRNNKQRRCFKSPPCSRPNKEPGNRLVATGGT